MNKDLMMKAVVQYKGVWPSDMGIFLITPTSKNRTHNQGYISFVSSEFNLSDLWVALCTREEFESFVESLFDGAPDGTTHHSPEDKDNKQAWWKLTGDEMLCICESGGIYIWERGHFDKTVQLIPPPAKKTEPVPTIGPMIGSYYKIIDDGSLMYGTGESGECVGHIENCAIIRMSYGLGCFEHRFLKPLRTERELFVEQATKDYLDRVGSDAVNAKWFGRIFGAMYDSGCRYLQS